jgi:hypothetical protein
VNTRRISIIAFGMVAISATLLVAGREIATARASLSNPPTPAPLKTAGPLGAQSVPPLPTYSGGPLNTSQQAVQRAWLIDQYTAVWERPWSPDIMTTDPLRITIREFPSQTAADADAGLKEQFAAGRDAAIGAVWRITIEGHVHVSVPSMWAGALTAVYDGVTYTIAQNSADLVGVDTGPLLPGAAPITPAAPTQPPLSTPYP